LVVGDISLTNRKKSNIDRMPSSAVARTRAAPPHYCTVRRLPNGIEFRLALAME
jgi:hypothetical protein